VRPSRLDSSLFPAELLARMITHRSISPSGCWVWTGATNDGGYGIVKVGGRAGWVERTHRIAFAVYRGPVEAGVRILHRCDNPPCFNPAHLFAGTALDNTVDMHAKGRWKKPSPARGERSGTAKLTEALAALAVERLLRGDTRASIARDFGVSISTISKIATGKNWRHLSAGRGIVKSTRGTKVVHV
jgi:hypothetical protein